VVQLVPRECHLAGGRTIPEKGQHLEYTIEAHLEYFGVGLVWNENASAKLRSLIPVRALEPVLRRRQGEWYETDRSYLWWETWEQNPYTDPWSWFGKDFGKEWFDDIAKKFWNLVVPTHALVVEANKSLSGVRS
jgi:hypothetical protein